MRQDPRSLAEVNVLIFKWAYTGRETRMEGLSLTIFHSGFNSPIGEACRAFMAKSDALRQVGSVAPTGGEQWLSPLARSQ